MSARTDDRARAAYAAIAAANRPEVFIALHDEADLIDAASDRPADGPLAGLLLAVKNNVDVAGFATTAGCPTYAVGVATSHAPAVARLVAAGAAVLGVTNLDQFATGLVGQRSPYGGVRDARRPTHVSGGSSSGSAVAVALGLVDIAIGTDTAGSGRIPAAFQGIVGIKPTLGTVSVEGVVPACRSWDAVTILARDLPTASTAMGAMAGGPGTRPWPLDTPLAAPAAALVAIPAALPDLDPGYAEAFDAAVARLRADGCVVEPIDLTPFLAAATLLYDGALVAERHAAVGEFVDAHAGDADGGHGLDPTVAAIISRAGTLGASAMVRDLARLEELRLEAMALLDGFDALLVPTAPTHPSIAELAAEPIGVNSRVGTYTNFCNLFDLCAVAVPSGTVGPPDDPAQFGVTVVARPFHDAVAFDLAARVLVESSSVAAPGATGPLEISETWPVTAGARATELLVVGAHLRGQPLEHELVTRGARWLGAAQTAAAYSLTALATTPPKPGLVRVGPDQPSGASIAGELWLVPTGALGDFLTALPAPMSLGRVDLDDGRSVVGFGCTADAAAAGTDITSYGGWLAWLARDAGL